MDNKRLASAIIYLGIVVFIYYALNRQDNWFDRLSGMDGTLTVAHVYDVYTIKGGQYYEYIYKVDKNYYFDSTNGSNVKDFKKFPIQNFVVVYDKKHPQVHTVIWSYIYTDIAPLGTFIEYIPNQYKLIRKHTIGWDGVAPSAKKNDKTSIVNYNKKVKKIRF